MNTEYKEDIGKTHQYYMNILNCVPDIVYWTDSNCNLIGCNSSFVKLLGLKELQDFKGTPYQQMERFAHWPKQWIEILKLDDMNVIFTGEPRCSTNEEGFTDEQGKEFYFKSIRTPMFDDKGNVTGLIVVLTESTPIKAEIKLPSQEIQQFNDLLNPSIPNILVIEDNLIAQNVEKALLTSLNCKVDVAESCDKALELFNPGKYDLVLMDIGLENSSGYVVAKKLRQVEKNTQYHVPIIALTGYEADIVKYDCEEYFMEGAITKPLTNKQADQIIKHFVYHMDVPVEGMKSST